MLDVIDSFSRGQAESAKLIRSAAAKARTMHQAIDEIAAWRTRDDIRREEHESDTDEYLRNSMGYIRRIEEDARVRHEGFNALVRDSRVRREQLVNDAEELRQYGILTAREFESVRELDIQILLMGQCADDEKLIYEQAGDSLADLRARFLAISEDDAEQVDTPDDGSNQHVRVHYEVATVTRTLH